MAENMEQGAQYANAPKNPAKAAAQFQQGHWPQGRPIWSRLSRTAT